MNFKLVKIKMKKTDDILLKRLLLSVGILLFIRMGTFLPIPGINHGHLAFYIQQHPITKNLVSTFSGNDTFVIGLFTLNIFTHGSFNFFGKIGFVYIF